MIVEGTRRLFQVLLVHLVRVVQSGGITAAGAIAGATTIDGSGDLTMGLYRLKVKGNTDALSLDVGGGYGSTGATIGSAGILSVDGQFNHAANIIPKVNGSQNIGSTLPLTLFMQTTCIPVTSIWNERGDWITI